jgi:hypothetical protein
MLIDRCFHASRSRHLILESARPCPCSRGIDRNPVSYWIQRGCDAFSNGVLPRQGLDAGSECTSHNRIPLLALETEIGSSIVRSLDRHPNYQPLLWFVSGQDRELLCSVKWRSSEENVIIPARTVGRADGCAIADTIRATQEDARYKKIR